MATVQIVVDVAGEAAGTPGESRTFAFTKISPSAPLVTLSLGDTTGVTSYLWEIIRQPEGATAELSSTTAAEPTFTPTAAVAGTYLIGCTVNGGTTANIGLSFLTEHLGLRKPAPTETDQFNSTRGWEAALAGLMDEVDVLGGVASDAKGARRRAVIDIADCTAEPPTEVTGHRYIVDFTSGTVHAGWDGASKGDIVEFGGVTWNATTPNEGWVAYVDAKNSDYRYVDDGTPAWEAASADGQRRRAVIDIVDCTAAPPTEVEGARYIVDDTVGTIHGDWDNPSRNDIVEFNGTVWNAETPIEGWTVYVDEQDADYRFVDDGTGSWETVNEGREAVFPNNHIWIDADNGSDSTGDGSKALPYATLAAAAAGVAAPTTFNEYQSQIVFHVGPGVYSDPVTLPYRILNVIIGYDAVVGDVIWNHDSTYLFGGAPVGNVAPLLFLTGAVFGGLTIYNVTTKNANAAADGFPAKAIYADGCFLQGDIIQEQSGGTVSGQESGFMRLYLTQCTYNPNIPWLGTEYIGGERESSIANATNSIALATENCDLKHVVCGCTMLTDIRHTIFKEAMDYRINPVTGAGSYAGLISGANAVFGFGEMGFVDTTVESSPCVFGYNGVDGGWQAPIKYDASSFAHFGAGATYDNLITDYELMDQAEGVGVDNSGWSGNLGSEETVQAALDTIDGLKASLTIYDDTTVFTDVAASGGTSIVELDIGAIDDGICEAVQFTITAGSSTDTTLQLYNGDPSGGGAIIYEVPNYDLVEAVLDDRNCWYVDLPTTGELWVKVTNDGGTISSYSLRLRIKGDV